MMWKLLLLMISQAFVLVAGTPPRARDAFLHSASLAHDDVYHLFWTYDDVTEAVTFEVQVKTLGYVGFGLSPNGGMAGSDVVIGWVKDGITHFQDRYAEKEAEPKIDPSQDWHLLEGRENDTHTTLRFKRKLKTCDDMDRDITEDTMRVIWSYHPEDPMDSVGLPHHGSTRRGTKSLYLLNNEPPRPKLPDHAFYVDFTLPNVTVPEKDTTYWCYFMKVPEQAKVGQVIMIQPRVQPGHESLVHHVVIYACKLEIEDRYIGFSEDWESDDFPYHLRKCNTIYFAWAIGGQDEFFPDHVGFPIDVDVVRIEVHLDSPDFSNQPTYYDNSGLRMWFTPTPRENAMGTLAVGLSVRDTQIIPPYYPTFTNHGYCVKECLEEAMEGLSGGIKLESVVLHTHLAGVAVILRHFRNGTELPPIVQDNNYDFNYQQYRKLKEEVTIQAGDYLRVDCVYKSRSDHGFIKGGLGTRNEMCLAFATYYPKLNMSSCLSLPSNNQLLKIGGRVGSDVNEVIYGLNWTDPDVRVRYQELVNSGEIETKCDIDSPEVKVVVMQTPNATMLALPPQRDVCDDVTTTPGGDTSASIVAHPGVFLTFLLVTASRVF